MANRSLDGQSIPARSSESDSVHVSILSPTDTTTTTKDNEQPQSAAATSSAKLAPRERGILIRKNRKLAQIFGAESSVRKSPSCDPCESGPSLQTNTASNAESFFSPLVPCAESSFLKNQDIVSSDSIPSLTTLERTDDEGGEGDQVKSSPPPASSFVVSIDDRRQKIARLAKLHRYLGSGVPAERVFGITEFMRDLDLPPSSSEAEGPQRSFVAEGRGRSLDSPKSDLGEVDRTIPKLSGTQKAVHVRRASKMEKVTSETLCVG
jgi:hypothetical protein